MERFTIYIYRSVFNGKTIVATDVDGTSEIVKDVENGLLSSTKNNEKIADDILYLIKNEDEKTRMKKIQNIYII